MSIREAKPSSVRSTVDGEGGRALSPKARNNPMNPGLAAAELAPRCGATNRRGEPCQSPAIRGKTRCRLHGGRSTGPPAGNQNAWKHGLYTKKAIAWRRQLRETHRKHMALLREVEKAEMLDAAAVVPLFQTGPS